MTATLAECREAHAQHREREHVAQMDEVRREREQANAAAKEQAPSPSDRILDALRVLGESSSYEVAAHLDIPVKRVAAAFAQMGQAKVAKRTLAKARLYRLPDQQPTRTLEELRGEPVLKRRGGKQTKPKIPREVRDAAYLASIPHDGLR